MSNTGGSKEMRRGYVILIAGGVLFAVGIAVTAIWGVQLASVFMQDNTFVDTISIEPGRSVDTTRQVTDTSRPLSVAVHIQGVDANAATESREDIRLVQTVRDPSGAVVSRNEFSGNLFTTFTPKQEGNYVLMISNTGTESVKVDGTFGYVPFVSMADGAQQQVDFGQLSGVIAGGTVVTIGFFTMIAGIIVVVLDRQERSSSTVTSEGGITYRKD
jgi:hypothetical protein